MEKTKVIFRKYNRCGQLIAIFPELPGDRSYYTCSSYMHVGQHCACDPYALIHYLTEPAKPDEYKDLYDELVSIGYALDVKKRMSQNMFEVRRSYYEQDKCRT